jgi:hypothetical protein
VQTIIENNNEFSDLLSDLEDDVPKNPGKSFKAIPSEREIRTHKNIFDNDSDSLLNDSDFLQEEPIQNKDRALA